MRTLNPFSRPAHFARPSGGIAVLVLLLGSSLLIACGDEPEQLTQERAPAVEALAARAGTLPLEERLNGVVRADNQVVVRPEVSGRVVEVLVRNGDAVKRGQPLVRLEPGGLRDRLRQAEADLRLAEAAAAEARARMAELTAEVSRTRKLAAEALVSEVELETGEARLDAARASAEQAEAGAEQARAALDERRFDLERAVVRAPVAGRVGHREVEVGSIADSGTALFVLGNLDDLVVEIPLTEQMLGFIREGQRVQITPRGADRRSSPEPLTASLSRISPFLAPGSFTTTGEIDVEGSDTTGLRPGMFVTVDILYGESERATLVPASALWEDPRTGIQGMYVFTEVLDPEAQADDDTFPVDPGDEALAVELRSVEVVAEGRSVLGVRGVEAGEWVVVVGQHLLAASDSPRARVRVTQWDRVTELQELQREDLLANFLAEQRRLALERGARPPSNEEFLRAPAAGSTSSGGPAPGRDG